jgi:signal transduction histidine kinase
MQKLRIALLIFLIALSLPLSYVLTRTYSGLHQEEVNRLRFFAAALFDAMERELAELMLREEERPVDAYGISDAAGISAGAGISDAVGISNAAGNSNAAGSVDKGQTARPVGNSDAPPFQDENALSDLPSEPWLLGYLQNQPDGSFQTPLVATDTQSRSRLKELAAFNARFNTVRYQAPQPLTTAKPQTDEGVQPLPPKKSREKKAQEKDYADTFLYKSSPSKARSAITRQEVRLEEITAKQARKVTRSVTQSIQKPPAASSTLLAEAPDRGTERTGAEPGLKEAELLDTAIADTAQAISMERPQQVEVAPFQALLIDADHAFIFRRILIRGEAYRQGFVLDLGAFSNHLLATHFADQPLARFTQLQLWTQPGSTPRLLGSLGKRATASPLQMERQFPRPFAFLQARLVVGEIPPSSARAPLRLTLIVLGAVLLVGLLAIYRSVNAQVALSQRRAQFASAVTHELKTPLTTIRMYVEMLAQGMAADPQRQKRYFRVLDTEIARLGRLINNVLELSRLEKNARPLTYGYGDLSEVIAKVETALGPQLKAAGFDFKIENRLKEPFAYDGEVLVQVLINLIENSLKFGRDGERKEICLTITRHKERVSLAVSDTGPGIPRGEVKRIFEDFYRAEDEMTRTTAGTGIGLALVKRFARAMAGQVTAHNNPTGGCTITLTLPVNKDTATA